MDIEKLRLIPLSHELIEPTVKLCGECVGENLYSKELLLEAVRQPNQKFLLLVTPENKPVAYIYFRLIDLKEAEQMAKQSLGKLLEITQKQNPVFGNLQSIGVLSEYRNHQLSKYLVKVYLEWLMRESEADIAFGVFWKPCGKVPMEKTLKSFGFCHLADAKRVWYDKKDLVCPVCKGRCECDAAIYYKRLERDVVL